MATVDPTLRAEKMHLSAVKRDVKEHWEKVREVTSRTAATVSEMENTKLSLVDELIKQGLDRETAQMHVESKTTFRSVLMARAAYHRAYATGLPVRLFVGLAHANEIAEFLSDESKVDKYVATLPNKLQELYYAYERHAWWVTDTFQQHAHKFDKALHPTFYAWLALEHSKALYTGHKTTVVNVADFRRAVQK